MYHKVHRTNTGFSIRIEVGGRIVEVGGEGVREAWGHAPPGNI